MILNYPFGVVWGGDRPHMGYNTKELLRLSERLPQEQTIVLPTAYVLSRDGFNGVVGRSVPHNTALKFVIKPFVV